MPRVSELMFGYDVLATLKEVIENIPIQSLFDFEWIAGDALILIA
jgi:hypothetical protein